VTTDNSTKQDRLRVRESYDVMKLLFENGSTHADGRFTDNEGWDDARVAAEVGVRLPSVSNRRLAEFGRLYKSKADDAADMTSVEAYEARIAALETAVRCLMKHVGKRQSESVVEQLLPFANGNGQPRD
jgi:hypothetical protein